jgi:hypothetical protein
MIMKVFPHGEGEGDKPTRYLVRPDYPGRKENPREALREMRRELAVFWIINRYRDSIEFLYSFQEAFPDVLIHVCRNLFFGDPERFDLYNNSKAREAVEKSARPWTFQRLRTASLTGSIPNGCPSAPRILGCLSEHGPNYSDGGYVAWRCLVLRWRKRHERGRYHPYRKVRVLTIE